MNADLLAPQELVRKAVIEVAQLPEKELLIVIEMVDSLKKQRARPNKELAAEILAKAKARAEEVRYLSRDEAMEKFGKTLDSIRAEAIEGEWKRDLERTNYDQRIASRSG